MKHFTERKICQPHKTGQEMYIQKDGGETGSVQSHSDRLDYFCDRIAHECPLRPGVTPGATHFMCLFPLLYGLLVKWTLYIGGDDSEIFYPVSLQRSERLFIVQIGVIFHHLLVSGVRNYLCALQEQTGDHNNGHDDDGLFIHKIGY